MMMRETSQFTPSNLTNSSTSGAGTVHFSNRFNRINLITSVILGLIALVWIYPVLWPVFASFKTPDDMFKSGWWLWPKVWTLDNYVRAWVNAKFSLYLFNTIFYCTVSTALTMMVSATTGYVLARYKFPGSRLLTLLIMGFVFLPMASSILPLFELMQFLNLLNSPAAIILALAGGLGLPTLLFQGYFRNIPQDLYDAAIIDGANFIQQFRLALPLARPIIATTVIFTFNSAWQDFFTPLIFTFSRPELRTVSVGLRAFIGQYTVDISGFAAAETISVIPIIIVFFFFQKQIVSGLAGAVTGQ